MQKSPGRATRRRAVATLFLVVLVAGGLWRLSRTPEFRFLAGSDLEQRSQAIQEIYRKPAWRAQWFLPRILRDKDAGLVREGLFVIVQRGFVDLVPEVRSLYTRTSDPTLKASALRALGDLGASDMGILVREAMQSDQSEVRCAGASVAALAGDRSLTPLLLECAKSGAPAERRAALQTMIALRDEACLPLLLDELETEQVLDAGAALRGLIEITGNNEGLDVDAWREVIGNPPLGSPIHGPLKQ